MASASAARAGASASAAAGGTLSGAQNEEALNLSRLSAQMVTMSDFMLGMEGRLAIKVGEVSKQLENKLEENDAKLEDLSKKVDKN